MLIGIDGRPLQEKFGGVKAYTLNLLHALFRFDKKNEYHVFYNSFKSGVLTPLKRLRKKTEEIRTNFSQVPNFNQYPNVHTHQFRYPNKLFNLSLRVLNYPKLNKLLEIGNPASPRENVGKYRTGWKLEIFWMPNLNFSAFTSGLKYILTVHDLSFHHFPYFYSLKQQLWHKAVNYKKLIRDATKIIAVSEYTKNDLIETFDLPAGKIEVVYPCINQQQVTGYRLQVTGCEPYILYLGTLEPRKNVESVIEAYKIFKKESHCLSHQASWSDQSDWCNTKLVIAGPHGWKYKTIFKLTKRVGLRVACPVPPYILSEEPGAPAARVQPQADIIFLDHVSEKEKIALYQNAKLFVFPSFYEGFGLPPLEAASFGVPVIASAASSLPEVLGEAAFYVNSWNVAELAKAIELLLSDENLRAKLSQTGKARAQKFQAAESAAKLLRLFEETTTI